MSQTSLGNINLAVPGQEEPTTQLESPEVPAPVAEPAQQPVDITPDTQEDMTPNEDVKLSEEVKEAVNDPATDKIDVVVEKNKTTAETLSESVEPKGFYATGEFDDRVRAIGSEELLSKQDLTKYSDEAVKELFLRTGDADLDAAVEEGMNDIVGFFVAPKGVKIAMGGEANADARELTTVEDGQRFVDIPRVMAMADNQQMPTFVSYFSDGKKFSDFSAADKLRIMSMTPDVAFAAIRVNKEDFDETTDYLIDIDGNGVVEPIRLVERPSVTANHVITKRKIRASDGKLVENEKGFLTAVGEFLTFDRNAEDKKLADVYGMDDAAQRNFQLKLTENFGSSLRRGTMFKDGIKGIADTLADAGMLTATLEQINVAAFDPAAKPTMDTAIANLDRVMEQIGDPSYSRLNFDYSADKIAESFGVSPERVRTHLRTSPDLAGKAYELAAELALPSALWVKGTGALASPLGQRVLKEAAKKFDIDPKDVPDHYLKNPELYTEVIRDVGRTSLRLPAIRQGLSARRALATEKAFRGFEELPEMQRAIKIKKLEKARGHREKAEGIRRRMEDPKLTAADRSVLRNDYRKEILSQNREIVEAHTTRYARTFARDEFYVLSATAAGQQAFYNHFDMEENMAMDLSYAITGALFGELIVERGGGSLLGFVDDVIEGSRVGVRSLLNASEQFTTGEVSPAGMTRRDAIRGFEIEDPKLFAKVKKSADSIVKGLDKDGLGQLYKSVQGMQSILDRLTSYVGPDGLPIIKEEDLPFTIADILDVEMMRAVSSVMDTQIDLQSAGGVMMNLNMAGIIDEKATLNSRRREGLVTLRNGYDNLLARDNEANFMDAETRRIMEGQRIGIEEELKDLEADKAAIIETLDAYKKGLEDTITSGDAAVLSPNYTDATDETSSDSFRILEQHLAAAITLSRLERPDNLTQVENLKRDLDAIEEASNFQKNAFGEIAQEMSVMSSNIDELGYGGFLVDAYERKLASELFTMQQSFQQLGEISEGKDIFADASGWFMPVYSREGRAAFIDPTLLEEYLDPKGDPRDLKGLLMASMFTAGDIVKTPAVWRGMVDNAAGRFFDRSFDAPLDGVKLVEDMRESLGEEAAERFDTVPVTRSIDAWVWLKNFADKATDEDIAKLDGNLVTIFKIDDMSQASFRELSGRMDLPVSSKEATAILAFMNKASNVGTDEAKKLAARRARNELMATLGIRPQAEGVMVSQGGFYSNYFKNPEPDVQFTEQHARSMEASRSYYNRRDSASKLGAAVAKGNAATLNTSIQTALKAASRAGYGPAEAQEQIRAGIIQPVLEAFGEWDAAGKRWIITEDSAEAVANYFSSMHAYLYKVSDAGKFIMEDAARNRVGLGDYVTESGVESMLRHSDKASGTAAVFANTPGRLDDLQIAMQNVKVHRRTGVIDENGYPVYEEVVDTAVVNAEDFLSFHSIEFVKDHPEYQRFIDQNYFDALNGQIDKLKDDFLSKSGARRKMLEIQGGALAKQLADAKTIDTSLIADYILGDEGFRMMQAGRDRFVKAFSDDSTTAPQEVQDFRRLAKEQNIDISERGLMMLYDKEMARVVSLSASQKVTVDGVFDLPKLRSMLDVTTAEGRSYVRALEEFNPEALSFLQDTRDFMERFATNPRMTVLGKPLQLRPEAAINKFWQVSRRQVGVRYAVLELLFRANRFNNFSGATALMSSPEAGRMFLKMMETYMETGKAPSEREAEAMYKLLIPVLASEMALQNSADETSRIYSINDVDSHLLKPSIIKQQTPFPVKLAGRTYLSEREREATQRQMKSMTGQEPQQGEQTNENLQ